jgi:methionyl-tRNA formyltransferase
MKVFFIGTVDFSRAMLLALLEVKEAEIVGIATKAKSQFNSDHSDLSDIAIKQNIPYKYVKDINAPHIVEWISHLNADIVYCMGWSSLIKKEVLEVSPKGVIGFHPAKLPQNRGRHPLIWALALGLKESATTFFKMDEGADSGDILSQESFEITNDDTAATLYQRIITIAANQVRKFTYQLSVGNASFIAQNHSESNYWRKRGKSDGEIDFRMNSENICNLVRALTKPYVGSHFEFNGKDYKVWEA